MVSKSRGCKFSWEYFPSVTRRQIQIGNIGTAGPEIFRQNIEIALSPVLLRFHLVYIDKCNPFTGLSTERFYSNAKKERKFSTSPCAHINVKPLIIGTCFMSIFCRCRRGKEKKWVLTA